jgi:DNA (cytosine-5)-methyltransferase 1
MIKILDICSGIGGFSLGLEATGGFDTVAFCEFDDFCCKVLNKHWPNVPIYKDLKEIGNDPARIIQEFDLICGGIPCQPFSLAGKQKGKEDDRHLWPYMYAIVKSKKPTWVIVENVGGFVNVALDDVCLDLETQGYATQSFIIPACSVEAPHKRDRIWILGKLMANAHDTGDRTPGSKADGDRQETIEGWQEQSQLGSSRSSEDVANTQELGSIMSTTNGSAPNRIGRHTWSLHSKKEDLKRALEEVTDVANPKLVSSDSISDSGSNTKTESEQGQKTGNLDRSSGRQDVANSKSSQSGEQTQWEGGEDTQRGVLIAEGLRTRGEKMFPTPAARDWKDTGENTDYEALAKKSKLAGAVKSKMYPTPRSSEIMSMTMESALNRIESTGYHSNLEENVALKEQNKMWPTPNASDNRDRGNLSDPAIQRRIAMGKQVGLTMAVKDQPGKGTLNPNWVEWLMGYPQGWTDISDSSENLTSQG